MRKAVTEFKVIRNIALNSNSHLIVLQSPEKLLPLTPGQFANVEVPGNKDVFLRRPFSIFEIDYDKNTISFLVKILGKGSKTLANVKPGEILSLIYPLGKGFTIPEPEETVLAIGGGSGVVPILFLVLEAGLLPGKMNLLLGARTKEDLFPIDKYENLASCFYTTDDGSFGERGVVTNHSLFSCLSRFDRVYACGPLPMMKEIAAKVSEANISCEVSLENLMACGFGVCLCCIEPTVKGNLSVCTEGPVFNIKDLKW